VSNERFFDVGGRRTRVVSGGTGPPLVWLHDTRGNLWSEAHQRLSTHFTVLAPSLPGSDDSSSLDGIDGPEDVVFWLLDLLPELGPERPTLLGCGLGGWLAAEFAVRYPERLSSLVLVDAYGLQVAGALAEDEFALTPSLLRPLVFVDPDSELAQATLPDVEPPERAEAAIHARVAAARLAWQFPYNVKLRPRLRRARLPALVIWGEHDRLVPLAHGEAYAEGLPEARLVVLPDVGHYPYLEAPEQFAQPVQAFLASLPGGVGPPAPANHPKGNEAASRVTSHGTAQASHAASHG
jgi:pimeloyl-ACP methyl ester carboxylesterase